MQMAIRGSGRRGDGWGNNRMPPALDQQAFIEAIGVAAAMITQTCAMVSQGRSNDLQRLKELHPPIFRGGWDSMVRTTMAIEGEIDDTRSIRDAVASKKRKESLSSYGSGKKQRTSVSQGSLGQDQGHQGQGQGEGCSYTRPMTCYHYH